MRAALVWTVLGLGLVAGSAVVAAVPAAAPPAARTANTYYMVVEGAHSEAATAQQQLTVLCPGGRKAFGAGFSAVVRTPPTTQGGQPGLAESGLDDVRSFPDNAGTGWQVSGISPDAVRLKMPWRLVVRVVCMQVPG
jgi:hypothetical protein